jgi:hypothetical protein
MIFRVRDANEPTPTEGRNALVSLNIARLIVWFLRNSCGCWANSLARLPEMRHTYFDTMPAEACVRTVLSNTDVTCCSPVLHTWRLSRATSRGGQARSPHESISRLGLHEVALRRHCRRTGLGSQLMEEELGVPRQSSLAGGVIDRDAEEAVHCSMRFHRACGNVTSGAMLSWQHGA